MAMSYTLPALIVLAIKVVLVSADPLRNGADQIQDFCHRFDHRTAVLGNNLYVDGGFVNLFGHETNYTNNALLSADLLNLTDLHTTHRIVPSMEVVTVKNTSIPSIAGGTLWPDPVNGVVYSFGGYLPELPPQKFETYIYDVVQQHWLATPAPDDISYVAYGMSALAEDAGVGYYLGGYHDNRTQEGWSSGRLYTSNLVSFDMNTRSYSNQSGPDLSGRGEGLMVFIPASTSGLLIYFGGVAQDHLTREISGVPMTNITIYDIATSKWYTQTATGEAPEQRTRFCGVVAYPDDKSSFNIYVHGGLRPNGANINGTTAFDDVYILTLPAFVWIKWYSGPSHNSTKASTGHHSMTCDVINGTQMIVMGGTFPSFPFCEWSGTSGQHVLNLAQNNPKNFKWSQMVLDFPPYTVPSAIVDVVGGTSKGGANVTSPVGPNATVNYDYYLFQRTYKTATRTPTPLTTDSSNGMSHNHKTPERVVAGAVVGAILLILAAVGGTLVFRRYTRKRKADDQQLTKNDEMAHDGEQRDICTETELGAEHLVELHNGQ